MIDFENILGFAVVALSLVKLATAVPRPIEDNIDLARNATALENPLHYSFETLVL